MCWQTLAVSVGWYSPFPIYVVEPLIQEGYVFWEGTMPMGDVGVRFTFFERKY
jgi:hypothetical protein